MQWAVCLDEAPCGPLCSSVYWQYLQPTAYACQLFADNLKVDRLLIGSLDDFNVAVSYVLRKLAAGCSMMQMSHHPFPSSFWLPSTPRQSSFDVHWECQWRSWYENLYRLLLESPRPRIIRASLRDSKQCFRHYRNFFIMCIFEKRTLVYPSQLLGAGLICNT